MESEDPKVAAANGTNDAAAEEHRDGSSSDELVTPTDTAQAAEDPVIKTLHDEIQDLRRDKSDLQRSIDEKVAEMEKAEVGQRAIAGRVAYLEGQLAQAQEDLISASTVVQDAEAEAVRLRSEVERLEREKEATKKQLEEKLADLDLERGKKEREILVLREELKVSEEMRLLKEEELQELQLRTDGLVNRSKEAMEEAVKLRVSTEEELESVIQAMREKSEELERDSLVPNNVREEELEKTVKELSERNLELQEKISELSLNGTDSVDLRSEMGVLTSASSSKVSLSVAALAAVSTGTVAVALTAFYLRARQR